MGRIANHIRTMRGQSLNAIADEVERMETEAPNRLVSLFRVWANCSDYSKACRIMAQIREAIGDPTAEDEIKAMRQEKEAN